MIKNTSILSFVNTIFLIAFSATIALFFFFMNFDKERHLNISKQRYSLIANAFLKDLVFFPSNVELNKLYTKFEVKEITNFDTKLKIINKAKVLHTDESEIGRVRILSYRTNLYVYIQRFGYNLLLIDIAQRPYSILLASIALSGVILLLIILYYIVRRKLSPLKRLNETIENFSKGDFSVEIIQDSRDEVGTIAHTFNDAKEYINRLIESKNLFMRNIMHELKTPIAKATILAEYMEDKEKKETMKKALNSMNSLLTQLARIEELSTFVYKLERKDVKFHEIITNACENLFIEDEDTIIYEDKNLVVNADVPLFSVAVQNLIDNGIKFSSDNRVEVVTEGGVIKIISKSPKLTHKLTHYVEPFVQERKNSQGFGLGLYIVNEILKLHSFDFAYEFKDEKSYFIIIL